MPAFVVSGRRVSCDNRAMNASASRAVLSPCIGICSVDARGLCEGCLRTLDEIARWSAMGDAERLHVMDHVLPQRESACDGTV